MTRPKRPLEWYASWMVGDGADGMTRSVLVDLETAIQEHRYDEQTIEEIILILDHECLCWKSQEGLSLHSGGDIDNVLRQRLETSRTDQLIIRLSECLVRSINPASHYIRELQSRALVSALALLHAQGVTGQQAEFHESLRSQFNARFQDLIGLPRGREHLSVEMFRRIQCSYFLCLGSEYAKLFVQARPIIITALSRAVSLAIVGFTIATLVVGSQRDTFCLSSYTDTTQGGQYADLQATLQKLEGALRPIWTSPADLFQALCSLQELTKVTTALAFYSKVIIVSNQNLHEVAAKCCRDLAAKILDKIHSLFKSHPRFPSDVRPTSLYMEYFLAFFNRGPADFGHYLYFYGLLDCASQLSSFLSYNELPLNFRLKLDKIILESTEPSYRWKAVSVLRYKRSILVPLNPKARLDRNPTTG
ncbi:hypothetical protein MMC16_002405 [Acarospora aff. strigata]|nr:hypothetical protein [Acarospora aff. strigata]